MPKKDDNLRARFSEFRSASEVAKETAYVDNAIQISQYVEKTASIDDIKADFASGNKSPKAIELESVHQQRTMGALLYGKLALEDYIKNNLKEPSTEKSALTELSSIVGNLYSDLRGNKGKVKELLEHANSWLNNHATTTANKEDAHKLCQGLYTMLTCLNIEIANLSGFKKQVAGEALTKATTGISQLLSSLESTAKTLETQLAEKAAAEQGKVKSMHDHFNEQYLAIINKEGEDHPQRLAKLKEAATGVNLHINQLLTRKKDLTQLEETQKALQTLLRAANENDTRTMGRLYFADFVTTNKTQFDILLKNLPEDKKKQFDSDMEAITNPTTTQSTTAAVLGVMSWITSPTTLLARAVTPTYISNALSAVIPDTQDSYCKTRLKTLTQETLATIGAQMKTKQEEIETLQTKLASGNGELQKLIEKSEPQALQDIVTANTATIELAEESSKVIVRIKHLDTHIVRIKHLDTHISGFIKENDNAFKKFCDFFARFGEWFSKPSLSEKIAEAQQLKSELKGIQAANQQALEEQMSKFNDDPEVSDPIKVRLKQQLEAHDGSELTLPPTKSTTDHLHAMKDEMARLKIERQAQSEHLEVAPEEVRSPIHSPTT